MMRLTENTLTRPSNHMEFHPLVPSNSSRAPVRATYLAVILFSYLLLLPIMPEEYSKYYSVVLAVTVVARGLTMAEWKLPKSGAIQAFLLAEGFALATHFLDVSSALNIISSVSIFSAICLAVSGALDHATFEQLEWKLFRLLLTAALLMFIVSTILTFIHYPTAPRIYFWEASNASGGRLLLMRGFSSSGGEVGHSDVIWVVGGILLLNEKYRRNLQSFSKDWFFHHGILLAGTAVLIRTGTRISLLILFEAFLLFLNYRRIVGSKIISVVNLLIFGFYLSITFFVPVSLAFGDAVDVLQRQLPGVRLSNGNGSQDASLLSGREVFNQALVVEIGKQPLIGQGHGAPILKYGVNQFGSIADGSGDVLASVESGLVTIVAYGYPVFILYMVFMFWPMIRALSNRSLDAGLSCTMSAVVFLTFITEGAFESWYGSSLILGLFTIMYSVDRPAASRP